MKKDLNITASVFDTTSVALNSNITNLEESFQQLSHDQTEGGTPLSVEIADEELSTDSQENPEVGELCQNVFDEDAALAAKLQAISDDEVQTQPVQSFDCGICLETLAQDFITQFQRCQHPFCRDCLLSYAISALKERQYPILCPTCVAQKADEAAAIDYEILEILGSTAEELVMFEELQLATHSIPFQCLKCKKTMSIAREDYDANDFIICPLAQCHCQWCKKCLQEAGPTHKCDGLAELDQLMKEQGWKYCPSCRTPIQKISGCDSVLCTVPECHTRFCYRCGQVTAVHEHDC